MFKDMEQRLDEAEQAIAGLQDAINNILQMVSVLALRVGGSGSVPPSGAPLMPWEHPYATYSLNAQNKTPDTFPGPGATNLTGLTTTLSNLFTSGN